MIRRWFVVASYASEDREFMVAKISEIEKETGIRVWYDHAPSEGLTPGKRWDSEVENQVSRSNCLGTIFFVSDASLRSEPVSREMAIVQRHMGNYCVFNMTGSDSITQYAARLYADSKISEEMNILVMNMFCNDITYVKESDKWLEEISSAFDVWKKECRRDYFPYCNVIHNGRIVFFPYLIALTPFNFTYLVSSIESVGIEQDLTDMSEWTGREWIVLDMRSDEQDLGKQKGRKLGIVAALSWQRVGSLELILNFRRERFPEAALIILIHGDDLAQAEEGLRRAAEKLDKWREASWGGKHLLDDPVDEYCLRQTEKESGFVTGNDVLTIRGRIERWRTLISDERYYETIEAQIANNPREREGIMWLLMQQALSDDRTCSKERKKFERDPVLGEIWDRETFQSMKEKE